MAICKICEREMLDTLSCNKEPVTIDGVDYAQVPYHADSGRPCHDCGTPSGGFHHPGCDAERCPKCGGQLISCGCLDDGDDADEDDD